MIETTMAEGSQLHIKAARGQVLTDGERAAYEVWLRGMDEAEKPIGNLNQLRDVRERIETLESEQVALREQHLRLDREIAVLESMLAERTRGVLGLAEVVH